MKIEIKELRIETISSIDDFSSGGLFKVIQTSINSVDLVFANVLLGTWTFITPWQDLEYIVEDKLEKPNNTISEDLLLKTIAMLANNEKLSEL